MDFGKTTRRTVLICALLSAATLAAYWPVTSCDFVNYDDIGFVSQNPHVAGGLNRASVAWAFRSGLAGNWEPLTWLSHILDAQLFGLRPGWHHLTSLLFHTANGVLLFVLLQRMTGATWRSAGVAALFALHPLHVESVAWVAERKDVLSGFFFMLTLLAYARYAEVAGGGWQVASGQWQKSDVSFPLTPALPMNPGNIQLPTSNAQHPLNAQMAGIGCSLLDVGCWMFSSFGSWVQSANAGIRRVLFPGERESVRQSVGESGTAGISGDRASPLPLPGGEGWGEGEQGARLAQGAGLAQAFRNPEARLWYCMAVLMFALGLMSKPMLVTVPFVLLLLDYWPLRRLSLPTPHPSTSPALQHSLHPALTPSLHLSTTPPLRLILEKLPFFALSAASCVVTFIAQHEAEAVYPLALLSLTQRAANAVVACATYLEKTFWPAGLAVFYPLPDKLPVGTVILSSALLLGITAWIVAPPLLLWRRGLGRGGPFIDLLRRIARALGQGSSFLSGRLLPLRTTASSPCPSPPKEERETALPPLAVAPASCAHPYLAVGWFWFVGMLVPVIGLVQVGMQQVADRYTYLPLIGVFIMLVWGASAAVAEWEIRRPKPEGGAQFRRPKPEGREKPEARSPKGPASAPEITALQNGQAAASDIGLRPSFGFRPSGFGFPQLALAGLGGAALLACAMVTTLQLGYWHDSERLFRHALEVTRDNYVAQNNLGVALLKEGKLDEAITHYRVAVTLRPRWERPHLGLGEGLSRTGHYEEAAEQFSEALQILPGLVPALVQLGIARAQLGKPDEAVQALVEALRIAPDDVGAHNSLGSVFAQQGKHEEAVRQFEEAVRLKPDHAGAYNNLAISCKKLGRIGEAITHYREALRLQPDSLEALNNLAWLLAAHPDAQFRNGAEAVQLATRACELTKYQNPVTLTTLAAAYAETGQFQTAVSFAEQARELANGSQGTLAGRLSAMIKAFRAGRSYHAD